MCLLKQRDNSTFILRKLKCGSTHLIWSWRFVHETFSDAEMAYHFPQHHRFGPTWPLYSSSVNTCSCLKEKPWHSTGTLRALITQLCFTFSEGLCHKVVTNVIVASLNILCTRNISSYTCASGSVVCNIFLQNTWAVHKETELFFKNLLLYLQLNQTCLLQSTPLHSWYTAPNVFSSSGTRPGTCFAGWREVPASNLLLSLLSSEIGDLSVRKKSTGAKSGE